MLCALFNSYLLLASAEPGFKRFTIEVILGLDTVKLETANNGIGENHQLSKKICPIDIF